MIKEALDKRFGGPWCEHCGPYLGGSSSFGGHAALAAGSDESAAAVECRA